jgi:hypothetical protein
MRYRYRIQRIQQERRTGEKGERNLESHRKHKTNLLSFALVTCEDFVRTTRNSYNQQRRRKAHGHTDIRPKFARMSYIRPRSFLPESRLHTTSRKNGQIFPVCRIYGQQRFWLINPMHTGNRIKSLINKHNFFCSTQNVCCSFLHFLKSATPFGSRPGSRGVLIRIAFSPKTNRHWWVARCA